MSDIPDEFKERAREALQPWLHNIGHETTVARALMAERKRALEEAAKVAEEQAAIFASESYAGGWAGAFGELFACREVAAAIRRASEG